MKGQLHAFHRAGGELEGDFELNIAPIIDCFTVLITYLLISASFFQITVMDVGVNGNGEPNPTAKRDAINVSVQIAQNSNVTVKISGKESASFTIPAVEGAPNWQDVSERLKTYKKKYPDVDSAIVSATNSTEYKDVVHVIDGVRESFPLVSIGDQ